MYSKHTDTSTSFTLYWRAQNTVVRYFMRGCSIASSRPEEHSMTAAEAALKLAVHAGRTADFGSGYRYRLKYGFDSLQELQDMFDEIFACLKVLQTGSYFSRPDKEVLADISELLWGSVLYMNSQEKHCRAIGVFAEVLSETLLYLLEDTEDPFAAFDAYKENYGELFSESADS